MAAKKFYWLKLKRDFFKRHDIRIIESMPNGKDYILFYLKLLLESIDHEGELRFSDAIPYNEQMLSVITDTNIDIVRSAMKLFVELKLVEIKSDETIYMEEVSKMIGSETKWAEYKRKGVKEKVENLPQLTVCQRLSCEMVQLPNGKIHYVDEKRYGGNAGLALDRAEGRCEMCGETENLVIHHNNGFSNDLDDLLVLCRKCHAKLENFQRNSKTVPTEIEKEKEKETEQEKEIEKSAPPPSPKPVRHKYGAYKNVPVCIQAEEHRLRHQAFRRGLLHLQPGKIRFKIMGVILPDGVGGEVLLPGQPGLQHFQQLTAIRRGQLHQAKLPGFLGLFHSGMQPPFMGNARCGNTVI